jgi:anionic cell wall polymer biosynthesis LytR-Cps2A-Psr (LCP) family protein
MASQRLSLKRGNTLILNFTNLDGTGEPISLLGATISFTVKGPPGYDNVGNDSSAVWKIDSSGNTGNTCTFVSTPEDTWVQPQTYDWDITVKYADGTVSTVLTGTLVIIGIATNRDSQA